MATFSIAMTSYTPWRAAATIPPDGRFLSEVFRWVDTRQITLEGLGTSQVVIEVAGGQECSTLERIFRRWYPFIDVVHEWEEVPA
jgi:hypothetical protein